jgi:hypothetical protein
LQAVEVRRSLCRRVIQPTWRPKHIRRTIVMLSSRCKSLQRRVLSTQTSIACGTAPSAVQCSRNRPRDITRYSHVALRRPKQARHVHLSNRPTSQNQTNSLKPLTKNPFISASKRTRKTNKNHSTTLTIKLSSKSHKSIDSRSQETKKKHTNNNNNTISRGHSLPKKSFFLFSFSFSSYLSQYASGGISRALFRLNVGYPIEEENTRRKISFNQSHCHLSY